MYRNLSADMVILRGDDYQPALQLPPVPEANPAAPTGGSAIPAQDQDIINAQVAWVAAAAAHVPTAGHAPGQ
jgi:hypothetical protein